MFRSRHPVLCLGSSRRASINFPTKPARVTLSSDLFFHFSCCSARNPCRIRTSAKRTRNPFRIRTSKTQDLKPFRIRTYGKTGVGWWPHPAVAQTFSLCSSRLKPLLKWTRMECQSAASEQINLRTAAVVRSGGNAQAAKFVGVILAIEDVPLLAVFEDFLFLRRNLLADFEVGLFFFVERRGQDLHYLLADRVAVLNKLHVVAGDQHVSNLMGQSDNLFA